MPSRGKYESPVSMVTSQQEKFTLISTFGCRVWVQPFCPASLRKRGKFHADSQIGIFLGFCPSTTRNKEYYDEEIHQVKIASNFRFDEEFTNLPLNELNPNAISLSWTNDGEPLLKEFYWCSSNDRYFINTPFVQTYIKTVVIKCPPINSQKNCFGFVLYTNEVNTRVFISDIFLKI